jgi:hypothetical protein
MEPRSRSEAPSLQPTERATPARRWLPTRLRELNWLWLLAAALLLALTLERGGTSRQSRVH